MVHFGIGNYAIDMNTCKEVGIDSCLILMYQSVMTESLATQPWHWLIGKLLAGVGVGALQVSLSECPPHTATSALTLTISACSGHCSCLYS